MTDFPTILGVIGVLLALVPYMPPVYQRFRLWGSKKSLNLISGLGLILTSSLMIGYSVVADSQLDSATGFILPFTHPSIPALTYDQASIFGNFASFFASTLIIGGLGMMLGVARLQKFHKLGTPTPDYIR